MGTGLPGHTAVTCRCLVAFAQWLRVSWEESPDSKDRDMHAPSSAPKRLIQSAAPTRTWQTKRGLPSLTAEGLSVQPCSANAPSPFDEAVRERPWLH